MVLTDSCAWISKLLVRFHTIPVFRHIDLQELQNVSTIGESLGMKQANTNCCATCHSCQYNKYKDVSPASLL